MSNDLSGQIFGRLTVLREHESRAKNGARMWVCQCSCGNQSVIIVSADRLKSGHTQSCGCLQRDKTKENNNIRAKYNPEDKSLRLFRIWKGMIARTSYDSQICYPNYGGRGITVCKEWAENFDNFKQWALDNGYSDDLMIDRIENDKNYCPENCRWSTRREQNNNQRSNIVIQYNGESHTAAQWADIMGIKHSCIYKRIYRNKCTEEILREYIERKT